MKISVGQRIAYNIVQSFLTSKDSTWFTMNQIANVTTCVARCKKTLYIKISNLKQEQKPKKKNKTKQTI